MFEKTQSLSLLRHGLSAQKHQLESSHDYALALQLFPRRRARRASAPHTLNVCRRHPAFDTPYARRPHHDDFTDVFFPPSLHSDG